MQHNTQVAKLLASENVELRYGNYSTASFDVVNRVLRLPNWKDMSKQVYDLMVGHEVGHALYTPSSGWHDSKEVIESCPKGYLNVIEDCRIERMIKDKYPGLSVSFNKGYRELHDAGFFGDFDIENLLLIDRINLKSKIGNLIDVEWKNDIEKEYYRRAMSTTTFEEVIELTRELAAYQKDLNEQEEAKDEQPEASSDLGIESEVDNPEDGSEDISAEGLSEDNGNVEEVESDDETIDRLIQDVLEEQKIEDLKCETDSAFKSNESELVDSSENAPLIVNCNYCKSTLDSVICSYNKLREERKAHIKKTGSEFLFDTLSENFDAYLKQVKKNSYYAVKEFELHKAAYCYSRSQLSRKGTIDVNKLYNYKLSDQIFSEVTNLADAKDHGMVLLLDLSGSMFQTLSAVIDQLIHLIMFCKQVNIPFEVYAFAMNNDTVDKSRLGDQDMDIGHCNIITLCTSDMSKEEFKESLQWLYVRKESGTSYSNYYDLNCSLELLGSTPLVESLTIMHHVMKKFRRKFNVQIPHFVLLSDGDAQRYEVINDYDLREKRNVSKSAYYSSSPINVVLGNKVLNLDNNRPKHVTADLLKHFNDLGVKTQGFFIANRSTDYNHKIYAIADETKQSSIDLKSYCRKEATKNKSVHFKDVLGYNDFYLIKTSNLEIEDDELEIEAGANRGKIASAFKKHARNKKSSKVLLTRFGKAVAV